ncbi:hypothetical protein, conserved in T. vivax [Trypanosoma vivax Y486]|uniref:Trypanosoma glutamic acid/alanine-rich protein domain-containing protein n=1 Tax=Trypanosoma vivax (strain Y486) TaxID=1055687 RepID=F9WVM2_TRYVY|nr:hypothetical protein, conserved in T. vivax [Trypanosoma vivax Y486]|eukprot:CCD21630.1 hypothetical protein, conserved in T. vivax [Trypanosoma vivax Y486]
MQALLTFLLPSVLAVASAGLGGAAHGRGAQVGASETDVNVSARKFSSLLKLHNETFKALLKRAKALWTEASDAVNEFEKVRKIAGDFKGKKNFDDVRKRLDVGNSEVTALQNRAADAKTRASDVLKSVQLSTMFFSQFALNSSQRSKMNVATQQTIEKHICWHREILKHMGRRGVESASQNMYTSESSDVLRIGDAQLMTGNESVAKWAESASELFSREAMEVHHAAGAFVRHVVEERAAEMEKQLNVTTRAYVWKDETQKAELINKHVSDVLNFLNGTQLVAAQEGLKNVTAPLGAALTALYTLKETTAAIKSDVVAAVQDVVCRAKAYLGVLRERFGEMESRLSDSKVEVAKREDMLDIVKSLVTSVRAVTGEAQASILKPKVGEGPSAAEAGWMRTEDGSVSGSEVSSSPLQTTGEARRVLESTREAIKQAAAEGTEAAAAMRAAEATHLEATGAIGEATGVSGLIAANVSVLSDELGSVVRELNFSEIKDFPQNCPRIEGMPHLQLGALQAHIDSDLEGFPNMIKVKDRLSSLVADLVKLNASLESTEMKNKMVLSSLRAATEHASKANQHHAVAMGAIHAARGHLSRHREQHGDGQARIICTLMKQLHGVKRDLIQVMQGVSSNERNASDASQMAEDAATSVAGTKGDDKRLEEVVAAAIKSREESRRITEDTQRAKNSIDVDVQGITLYLVFLKSILLDITKGDNEYTKDMIDACDKSAENVTEHSMRAALDEYLRLKKIVVVRQMRERVGDVTTDLVKFRQLGEATNLRAQHVASYANESMSAANEIKGSADAAVAGADPKDSEGTELTSGIRSSSVNTSLTHNTSHSANAQPHVVNGNLNGNTNLFMWLVVIGTSFLFLAAVFIISLWRQKTVKEASPSPDFSPAPQDLQSLCHSFVQETGDAHDCDGFGSEDNESFKFSCDEFGFSPSRY